MDEAKFQEHLEKLKKPSGPRGTWDTRVFTMEDYESMSPSQLSEVSLEMIKFTGVGSYILRGDLFDLIDYLDRTVSIPEDKSLEKYLHMTASLICLAQFQGKIDFNNIQLERLARHLERVIGPPPWQVPSMETESSIQIATFLAYPLLEGVVKRKLPKFISSEGNVQSKFKVYTLEGKVKTYKCGSRISDLYDELRLLEKENTSSALKSKLSYVNKIQPLFEEIRKFRNMLLHGELTACWHSITLLLLTYIILLEE